MKKLVSTPAFLCLLLTTYARPFQADDKNVIISNKTEKYEFTTGASGEPVIKGQINTTFRCEGFRTDIRHVEFYDDQTSIEDISLKVNGKKVKFIPKHEYYSIDNIFYSDARVCHFNVPLEKKGSETDIEITKIIKDPRYFTSVYFTEPYFTESKTISFVVPDWMVVEIKELNFEGYAISRKNEKKGASTIYTYTILKADARKSESRSPGPSYIYPHLLVMNKYADIGGKRITYFNTLADQYAWYHQLVQKIDNDAALIKQKAGEIIKDAKTDTAKIKAIFHYVQDNIRYIAFEDGIAGFMPEKAQEVLNKKYGDCKGMANLTKELLKAAGFDARLCWIGTNRIAYDYSTPSLSVDNHMICALKYKGQLYFLDATETYIGFDQYAERIQDRQVLIEDGDKYILERVPLRTPAQNTDYEKKIISINGTALTGKVEHSFKGESREWLLTRLHNMKKDKLSSALESYLSEGKQKYAINSLRTSELNSRDNELKIQYQLNHADGVSSFGEEYYIEFDYRKDLENATIDIEKRKHDILFPYKQNLVYETELIIPEGYTVSQIPATLHVNEPAYTFRVDYKKEGQKILYRKEITIKETRLRKSAFEKWNTDIQQLKKMYNEQVTLIKK
ncbi:MAG: hypothetical protein KIT80_13585 [Chitinophagaceae bacterium]|nr:hypothetical protein [Chitinophagaceae bacterium]MCW5927941.1 hypothetical protein [Chitinophagaceae bacterium]